MNQLQQLHAMSAVVSCAGGFRPLAYRHASTPWSRTLPAFGQPGRAVLNAPAEAP